MPTPQIDLLNFVHSEENPDERPRNAGDLVDRLTMALTRRQGSAAAEVVATTVAPARRLRAPPDCLLNSLQLTLLLIGPGVFRMGSQPTEVERRLPTRDRKR